VRNLLCGHSEEVRSKEAEERKEDKAMVAAEEQRTCK
jgi:hypothetical protein